MDQRTGELPAPGVAAPGWPGAGCRPVLGPDPQLPYDFSGLGPRLRLDFPLNVSLLGPGLRLNVPKTFLIFGVSSARVSIEKVDDFSGFSRWEVVK